VISDNVIFSQKHELVGWLCVALELCGYVFEPCPVWTSPFSFC